MKFKNYIEERFEKEGELNPKGVGRYVYRAVLARQFEKIGKHMKLIPTKRPYWGGDLGAHSLAKVFFAKTQKDAEYYGNILKRDAARPGEFMGVIRVPSRNVKELRQDPEIVSDLWTYKVVPLQGAEVWSGYRWVKLTKDLALNIYYGEWDDSEEWED